MGENVKIASHANLEYCTIGDGTVISPYASIGTAPQDLSYKGQKTRAVIGKNCLIKENVTINRGAGDDGAITKVGDKVMLMVGAHVAHNCVIGDEAIFANLATVGGHVHVGKCAFLGGMSVYHQNIRIGEYVIVSGFAGSRMDIPPFVKAAGYPASIHGPNTIGLKRRNFSSQEITNIRHAYRIILERKHLMKDVLSNIEELYHDDKNVMRIVEFIRSSKRGIYLGKAVTEAERFE